MKYRITISATIILIIFTSCAPVAPTKDIKFVPTYTIVPKPSVTPTLNRTATAQMRETLLALTPSKTPNPTHTITPTLDFSKFVDRWSLYHNDDYAISFEYPAVYDEYPYKKIGCNISVSTNDDNVYFDIGERITLGLLNAENNTLKGYVDKFVKDNGGSDFTITSRQDGTVGGVKAISIEYRFGGPNRYGIVTYFKRENKIYGLDFTAGAFCEDIVGDKASGMTEFGTYFHILESFRFTQ